MTHNHANKMVFGIPVAQNHSNNMVFGIPAALDHANYVISGILAASCSPGLWVQLSAAVAEPLDKIEENPSKIED